MGNKAILMSIQPQWVAKILNCYRNHTTLHSNCCDINVIGAFFIHDDCEDFEYFVKNEYLARNEE